MSIKLAVRISINYAQEFGNYGILLSENIRRLVMNVAFAEICPLTNIVDFYIDPENIFNYDYSGPCCYCIVPAKLPRKHKKFNKKYTIKSFLIVKKLIPEKLYGINPKMKIFLDE